MTRTSSRNNPKDGSKNYKCNYYDYPDRTDDDELVFGGNDFSEDFDSLLGVIDAKSGDVCPGNGVEATSTWEYFARVWLVLVVEDILVGDDRLDSDSIAGVAVDVASVFDEGGGG